MQRPTVYVIDDDDSMLSAVSRLLKSAGLQVQAFACAQEFLDYSRPRGPACLVLDIHMPGLGGLELQEELAEEGETLPIVFITGHADLLMGVRAMKGGALDLLPKPFQDQDLIEAVNRALDRAEKLYEDQVLMETILKRLESLTPREREVLALVVEGLLNKQIAISLGVAEKTVKVHRARLMEKMAVSTVAELVTMILKFKSLSPAGLRLGMHTPPAEESPAVK